MAYRNNYGITCIKPFSKTGRDKLDISFEANDEVSDQRGTPKWNPKRCRPVLLHIPNINEFEHSHINLTYNQAKKLHQWLDDYLYDPDGN